MTACTLKDFTTIILQICESTASIERECVCVYGTVNVCTCVISITTYMAVFGKLVLWLWVSVLCVCSHTRPGSDSINTFTVPGCRAAVDEHS